MGMFDDYMGQGQEPSRNSGPKKPDAADIFGMPDFGAPSSRPAGEFSGKGKKKKKSSPKRPAQKRGKARVALLVTAIILLNLFGGGVAYADYLFNLVSAPQVSHTPSNPVSDADDPVSDMDIGPSVESNADVDLVLLIGCDSRLGNNKASRSDTIMLAAIDRKHKAVKIVSLMRDLLVPIKKDGGWQKINHAFYLDTANNELDLPRTRGVIERTMGIKVDNFIAVDFTVFEDIVDSLGGIELYFESRRMMRYMWANSAYRKEKSKYGGFVRFKELEQQAPMVVEVNGAEAVCFARARYVYDKTWGKMDFSRTTRQRHVIDQIIKKAKTVSVFTLAKTATGILPSVTTNYSQMQILGYLKQLGDISSYDIKQMRVPIEGSYVQSMIQLGETKLGVLNANLKWNGEQVKKFIFEDDMTYEGDKYTPVKNVKALVLPDEIRVKDATESTSGETSTAPTTTASTFASPTTAVPTEVSTVE